MSIVFQTTRVFYPVGGVHLEKFDALIEIFHGVLAPLYGSQDKAIDQIRESKDRRCWLLYEGPQPVGVLVFKTVLSDEFVSEGVAQSVEIKSLFVVDPLKNSGKGIGSELLEKLQREVDQLALGHLNIHVTVSETKQESLSFFCKKGFYIAHAWKDRYLPGVTEYLLACPAVSEETFLKR